MTSTRRLSSGSGSQTAGLLGGDSELRTAELVAAIHQRFGLEVHARSVERALQRRKKNAAEDRPQTSPAANDGLSLRYEQLRERVLANNAHGDRLGLALLARELLFR